MARQEWILLCVRVLERGQLCAHRHGDRSDHHRHVCAAMRRGMFVRLVLVTPVLMYQNYHWWWQSFFIGGASAIWIFVYCSWYYFAKLNIQGFISGMLFFSYSLLACTVYGLLTGTVGFLTAYAFVRRIYG